MPSRLVPPAEAMVSLPAEPSVAVVRTPPVRSRKVLPEAGGVPGSVPPGPVAVAVDRAGTPSVRPSEKVTVRALDPWLCAT